jgi:Phytanoyl-CoA dioxygenase (PhyH)
MPLLSHQLRKPAPRTPHEAMTSLYAGDLFVFAATPASRTLVATARRHLVEALGTRYAPVGRGWRCPEVPFPRVAEVRQRLYADPDLRAQAARVVAELGWPARETRIDAPRLRVITAGAEREPKAAPVYVLHRDTWYACSQAQINWWTPLFDCPAEQAFAFYPQRFTTPVENSSADFDYARWAGDVGWHGAAPLTTYPAPSQGDDVDPGEEVRFPLAAGDLLLFSAAQLHRTTPNPVAGTSRLSLDFRTLTEGPGSGAPNVDNQSSGAEERVQREFLSLLK